MVLLVTSASGSNGAGYGKLLAFNETGQLLGPFTEDTRISDPRGLGVDDGLLFLNSGSDRILALDGKGQVVRDSGLIPGLNPGGGNFGPDGRYYVGSRSARTIVAFAPTLASPGEPVLSPAVVPFPRGFAFRQDGILFLASGIRPGGRRRQHHSGVRSGTTHAPVVEGSRCGAQPTRLAIAPNGNVVVSSEHPFGAPDVVTTIREYGRTDGRLVRVLPSDSSTRFEKPRGLRFGPDGKLYCAAQDEVVAFDFATGKCLGSVVSLPRLNGQAVIFFGSREQQWASFDRSEWPYEMNWESD